MTPNEITTVIASSLNKTFDEPFKMMLIKKVDAWRGRLVRNSLEKSPGDRKFFVQSIFLTLTSESEVNCELEVDLCDVAISQVIPAVLRANGVLFDYVGSIDGNNQFQETSSGMKGYFGKYSKKVIQYEERNGQIVIHGKANLPMVRVDAIFDNPYEVSEFVCGSTGNCNFWDATYPCPNDILQQCIQFTVQEFKAVPEEGSVPVSQQTDKVV